MREYDLIAGWYAANRGDTAGVPEVAALALSLRPGALVLDAGCGTGRPLTRVLLQHGCRAIALDSSASMLNRFRRNFPDVPAVRSTLESCPFGSATLDAVVAWGVLFHLEHGDQQQALTAISRTLKPNGLLLFTSGDTHGSLDGEPMHGVPFRYHSFSVDGYGSLLAREGLALQETHADPGGNTHYLARKGAR